MNPHLERPEGTETRLGRTVRATVATAVATSSGHRERHRQTNWLRDVILGGQDGLVNILGIVLGVIAGGGSRTVLLAAGVAAAITESLSMGAVGYTTTIADRDYYEAARLRELAEIENNPAGERDAVRALYAAKGFDGALLDQVVETITADRDRWLATVMDDELHVQPVQTRDAARSSVVV